MGIKVGDLAGYGGIPFFLPFFFQLTEGISLTQSAISQRDKKIKDIEA